MRFSMLLLCGLLISACGSAGEFDDPVIVATAQVRDVTQSVVVVGSTEYAHPVDVSTEIPGRIVRTFVREGEVVSIGQPLAQIDTVPLVNAVLAARVERDRAEIAVRRLALDSATATEHADLLSSLEIAAPSNSTLIERRRAVRDAERSSLTLSDARLAVELANVRLADAERSQSRAVVRAPFHGVVVRVLAPSGATAVTGTATASLAGIARLALADSVWIRLHVPVQYLLGVRRGHRVAVQSLDRNHVFRDTAVVLSIDDAAPSAPISTALGGSDQGPVTVGVLVGMSRRRFPADWPMGTPLEASILVGAPVRGLAVPVSAIVPAAVSPNGREGIWVVRDGRSYFQALTSGPDDGRWTITSLSISARVDVVVGSVSTLMLRTEGQPVRIGVRLTDY